MLLYPRKPKGKPSEFPPVRRCHVCRVELSLHPDAGHLALSYCGDCGKPTCGDHRDETSAARCSTCRARKGEED